MLVSDKIFNFHTVQVQKWNTFLRWITERIYFSYALQIKSFFDVLLFAAANLSRGFFRTPCGYYKVSLKKTSRHPVVPLIREYIFCTKGMHGGRVFPIGEKVGLSVLREGRSKSYSL